MQLLQKQKWGFSSFFAFQKSTFNFEHFQKKYDPDSRCISDIRDSEKRGWIYA